jgi:hypothetical protein
VGCREDSLENHTFAEAKLVIGSEGCTSAVGMRDDRAPPGWVTASRMKSSRREPGGPIAAIDWSSMGTRCEGKPERRVELRSGVGLAHSTEEAPEGKEGVEGRREREGNSRERARVRPQSRETRLPHLRRVNEVAQRDKRARITALLHHIDIAALERAFRRLMRNVSAGVGG